MQKSVKALIYRGETHYVAECFDISVVTQGKTIDETIENLREAESLHLEDEDLTELGLAQNPSIIVTIEVDPADRVA